jgi:hypothetical protein
MNDKKKLALVDGTGQIWQAGYFTNFQLESYKRKYRALGVYLRVCEIKTQA